MISQEIWKDRLYEASGSLIYIVIPTTKSFFNSSNALFKRIINCIPIELCCELQFYKDLEILMQYSKFKKEKLAGNVVACDNNYFSLIQQKAKVQPSGKEKT